MRRKTIDTASRITATLTMAFIVMGCNVEMIPPPVTLTPIPSPTATPTPTPAPNEYSSCFGYNWSYGTVTPWFITQVEQAVTAAGLEGSVQASTFGETDGCGRYHPMAVDYVFTVQVESLEAGEDLADTASVILEIAKRFVDESPAPNLGHLQLIFQSGDLQCSWGYGEGVWNSISGQAGTGTACPVPTSAESQRLADALAKLPVDLACDTSSVTANTQQAELKCERPEGKNRYIVSVTLRVNEKGYADTCFHGWQASEYDLTGADPMTVTDSSGSYFERDRSFKWYADGVTYEIFEQIKGGPDVTLPEDTREKVYLNAVEAGLIPGEGSDCR